MVVFDICDSWEKPVRSCANDINCCTAGVIVAMVVLMVAAAGAEKTGAAVDTIVSTVERDMSSILKPDSVFIFSDSNRPLTERVKTIIISR